MAKCSLFWVSCLALTAADPSCASYCKTTGCSWTNTYNCPWQSGGQQKAKNDGSVGYSCCCEQRTSTQQLCGGARSPCQLKDGQDCVGNDISNQPSGSASGCCDICATNSQCKAFTWDQGVCYMKSGCPKTNPKGGCTAGITGPTPPPAPTPSNPNARPALPSTAAIKRAKSIVAQMTAAEKASLLNGVHSAAYGDSHNGYYVGNIPAIPRLKVPSINMQDASQGFRTLDQSQFGQVTSWPCSLGIAANWDVNATFAWGVALGKEFRAKGANMILGPSLNVHRVPKGGRNAEYISGEDAYLGAQMVPQYVLGVQSQKVIANIKHFILNNQETNRESVNSIVGERALQEIYMAPFRAGARAGAASGMCSYNLVNGSHACDSASSMNRALKADLGWDGFITSDWGAVHADGYQDSGLDMDQPGNDHFFDANKLTGDTQVLDDMATRVVGALITVGAFDDSVCTGGVDCGDYLYKANATSMYPHHADLARSLAANGASLLKNEPAAVSVGETASPALPLRPNSTIAVIGAACNAPYDISKLSGWNVGNYYVMGGSGRVINPRHTSIIEGLRARAAKAGARIVTDMKGADVVVTCGASWSSEGADRHTLKVDQDADIATLVKQVNAANGPPVVVLLTAPGALVTSSFSAGASSIVSMFLAGQATGLAWADILFGDVNPAGRLPVTFPVSESDVMQPCPGETCEYTEGLAVGYRGLDQAGTAVAFPFGHGLSYTTFRYGSLTVSQRGGAMKGGVGCMAPARVCVSLTLTNTGKVAGAEVSQLYLTYPAASAEPGSPLRGFVRTAVLPVGSSTIVRFELTDEDVGVWDYGTRQITAVAGGEFAVAVGASSRDLRSKAKFTLGA